jgi:small subunit ribosomal protein S9
MLQFISSIELIMEPTLLRTGFQKVIASSYNPAKRRVIFQSRRHYATPQEPIRAAAPIRFTEDADQFARPRAQFISDEYGNKLSRSKSDRDDEFLLRRIRIIPASPSYFTGAPRFTDDFLFLSNLCRKYELLPQCTADEAPRVAWKSLEQYKTELGEPVRPLRYALLTQLLDRLNNIHPSVLPVEVQRALESFKRATQPQLDRRKVIPIDEWGRAKAMGYRKSSRASVFLVEGEGEVLVNDRSLNDYFGRLTDRESALWPLKATQRLDKYNVWALASGGGTTGQAEAITLGVARALVAHEPGLREALEEGELKLIRSKHDGY